MRFKPTFKKTLFSLIGVGLLWALPAIAIAQEDESNSAAPKTGALVGRVVNENGQPIAHAAVNVSSPTSLSQPRTTATDDAGNFEINGLDAFVYYVSAAAPSYIMAPREPESLPTPYRIGDSVTIRLLKGAVITGTVTSATGEPMVQVGVRATLLRDSNGNQPTGPRFPVEKLTDDRGVYRIYGLSGGTYLVSAGGRGPYAAPANAYDGDAPTFAPSSTRDTATEVVLQPGEELSAVDIRHRGEPGHAVSGVVSGAMSPTYGTGITLRQMVNGAHVTMALAVQPANGKGFAFYGVADGDYDLTAQSNLGQFELAASEPLRITVKGGDVTGLNLIVKSLASIGGKVALEPSGAVDCKNKRQPLLSETVLTARRSNQNGPKDEPILPSLFTQASQASPDKSGDFALRNLGAGQVNLEVRFFAKYWYLRSISREISVTSTSKTGAVSRQIDVAQNGLLLKFGERVGGLTVTLAEGAVSLRGAVKAAEGKTLPASLYVNLVPAEKESAEDVLRFLGAPVNADGAFSINTVPPGRYWVLGRLVSNSEVQSETKLRAPEEANTRALIRRAAEAAKTILEIKPCENVTNYELPFKTSGSRN